MNEKEYIEKIKATKQDIKQELIQLSYEEKIRRVVEMQKFSRDFKKDKDKIVYVWDL
ncbi:MAG: hypothetical protein SFU98_11700 [Leptospiraceae bacterium]|nr:hypothetical protein [Leptospiraceae bacterium]